MFRFGFAADVDDAAPFSLHHAGQGCVSQLAHAHEVERHRFVPFAVGRIDVDMSFAAARAVDKNIDCAHGFFSGLSQACGCVWLRDVDHDDVRGLVACSRDFRGEFVKQVFAAGCDAGLHAFSGERFRDGATYALACASD